MQNTQHPDDAAVDALATAMKAKLAKQRAKGYGGWNTDCTQQRLSDMLRTHVEKGDPVDVANFCAFLLARGEAIAAAQQAVQADVPVGGQSRFKGEKDWQWCSPEHVAMVLATPSEWQGYEVRYLYAHPAKGVPAQEVLDGGTPGPWRVRKRTNDAGEVLDCFVTAPDCQGRAYDAHILGDDYDSIELKLADAELIVAAVNAYRALAATPPTQQGMDAIAALQKVRDIAVSALLTGSLDRQDWIDDMDRIAAQAKHGAQA